jgi:quaternary ammonium compound-resistance protein SugE
MAWVQLFLASIFEVLWASSLKFLSITRIKNSAKQSGVFSKLFFWSLIPLICYAVFGICNIGLFSSATKSIPLAICYAVWMGLALFIQTMIDVFYFKENINLKQIVCMGLILVGVVGLRLSFGK